MGKALFTCGLLFLTTLGYAQVGGRATYQFLNLINSPRQAALGGKVITNFDHDPSQGLINPATINPEMHNQTALNYINYFSDVNYGTASYARELDSAMVFHLGVNYVDYGRFDGYDEVGNPTNTFGANEVAVSVGHSRNIKNTGLHLGANMKFISSRMEQYSSFGAALDVGLIYITPESNLHIAAVARNIGSQIKAYDEVYERLPFEVILGVSQRLQNVPIRWHFTLEELQDWNLAFANPAREESDLEGNVTEEDIHFYDQILRRIIVGVEFFPESIFNARLGFNARRSEELRILEQRSFAGISAGFGLKMNRFRLEYAYSRYSAAAAANFFGLQIDLN